MIFSATGNNKETLLCGFVTAVFTYRLHGNNRPHYYGANTHTQCIISVVWSCPKRVLRLPRDTTPKREAKHSELYRLLEVYSLPYS